MSTQYDKLEDVFLEAFRDVEKSEGDWYIISVDTGYSTLVVDFQISSNDFSVHCLFDAEKNCAFPDLLDLLSSVTGAPSFSLWWGAANDNVEVLALIELEKDQNSYPFMVGFTKTALTSILNDME